MHSGSFALVAVLLSTSTETWAVIACAASSLLLVATAVILAAWTIDACIGSEASYAEAVRGVQRFVALTERSRGELRGLPRLPLLDSDGAAATAAAIERARDLKHAARRALWSADGVPRLAATVPPGRTHSRIAEIEPPAERGIRL